jgi:hypothetical protein
VYPHSFATKSMASNNTSMFIYILQRPTTPLTLDQISDSEQSLSSLTTAEYDKPDNRP